MLKVWLEAKDESQSILRLISESCDCNTELGLRDRNIESRSHDNHMTITLQLFLRYLK